MNGKLKGLWESQCYPWSS